MCLSVSAFDRFHNGCGLPALVTQAMAFCLRGYTLWQGHSTHSDSFLAATRQQMWHGEAWGAG